MCPVRKEEFDMKFKSIEYNGFIHAEVDSEKVNLMFKNTKTEEYYSIKINY